jgi:hypothetical protein
MDIASPPRSLLFYTILERLTAPLRGIRDFRVIRENRNFIYSYGICRGRI